MAGYSSQDTWKQLPQQLPCSTQEQEYEEEEEEEEEEEALSLCDLPDSLIKEEDIQTASKEEQEEQTLVKESSNQEEFEFSRWEGDSLSIKSEMCAAEDIFYKGQILPLRHSFSSSSDNGLNPLAKCNKDKSWVSSSNLNKSVSSSESMDHTLLSGFNSFSSRSSSNSSRSTQHSSSASNTTNSDFITYRIVNDKNSKPRIPNQFRGSHPSPGPQKRHSIVSPGSNLMGSGFIRNRKSSSIWDFFKLGLIRTPGNGVHELQDLKVRTSESKKSSCGSSSISTGNSNSSSTVRSKKNNNVSTSSDKRKVRKQGLFEERGGFLLSGCSCTVNAVKPVPLNYVIKSSSNNNVDEKKKKRKKKKNKKTVENLIKQNEVGKEKEKEKEKEEDNGLGKQETSRHRTFEWVKELSIARYLDEQEKEVVASLDS